MRTIRLIWPDGSMTSGVTWRGVEDAVRSAQWVSYPTRRAFRADMRARTLVWSGVTLPPVALTSHDFIHAMADAGMFLLTTEEY